MRRFVLGVVCGLAVGIGLFWLSAMASRWVLHGPVDGASLAKSVQLHSGGGSIMFGVPPCEPLDGRTWHCRVASDPGSGWSDAYRVTLRQGSSCWDARRTMAGSPALDDHLDGCVHLWQWTLWDVLPD
jgi:hypothetical protein